VAALTLAKFTRNLEIISGGRWNNLACNVVRILSVDGTVRNQMKFWNDSKHPNVFSYSKFVQVGLSSGDSYLGL